MVPSRIFQSCIQGDFGAENYKNFEAVVLEGSSLVHWYRDNSEKLNPWRRAETIVSGSARFPGSIIRSDYSSENGHANLEVVVPIHVPGGAVELWHYYHDSSDVATPWSSGVRVTEENRRAKFSHATDQTFELYFTLSTWNPYQVMLMRTRIPLERLT